MKTYRIAIIGLGGMGHHHAEAVRAESNCELVGGADIDPGQARKWRERFAVAAVFAEYEEMMDELQPDIVIVATHSPEHCPATLAAARRGIHVFCEKPIALNLVEADAMVASCHANEVRFAINHIKRASLYNRHVQERIGNGEIGQFIQIRAFEKGGRRSGNALMEMGTHLYDWIRLFAGDMDWAHAHLLQLDGRESAIGDIKHTQEVDPNDRDSGLVLGERGSVSFRFKSGIHAQAEFLAEPRANDDAYGLDLIGTEGRMALRGSVGTELFIHRGAHQTPAEAWRRESLASEDMDEEGKPRDMTAKRLLLQRLMVRDLIAAIEEGRDPVASGRDGRDCLEMIHATWESHLRKGRARAPLQPREHVLERWRAGVKTPG